MGKKVEKDTYLEVTGKDEKMAKCSKFARLKQQRYKIARSTAQKSLSTALVTS
jgi:hypothetical protein